MADPTKDEEKARMEIGKKLKHLREIHNLSQQDMADILEIPRSAVSLIESGDRGVDVLELAQYANHFKKKSDELLAPALKHKENNLVASKFNHVHFSTASDYPTMAVQPAPQMMPPISAVVNACNMIGLGMAATCSKTEPVLKGKHSAEAAGLCRSTFCLSNMPLDKEQNVHALQYLVDSLNHQYPGCQPSISTNVNGVSGSHELMLLTMGT